MSKKVKCLYCDNEAVLPPFPVCRKSQHQIWYGEYRAILRKEAIEEGGKLLIGPIAWNSQNRIRKEKYGIGGGEE